MKFEPSEDEKRTMERERQKKPKNLVIKETLFSAFGIVFRNRTCSKISKYGIENFIKKANNLLESKEIIAYMAKLKAEEINTEKKLDMHNKKIKKIEKHIELLRKKKNDLVEELNKLQYQYTDDEDWENVVEKEKQLLISIGITPIDYCHGESFTRFLLLSLVESETQKPEKRYSDLNREEKNHYIQKLNKRIEKLESKHIICKF